MPEQIERVDRWMDLSRRMWNWGLECLKEFDELVAWDKFGKEFVPCNPAVPRWEDATRLSEDLRAEGWGRSCPIREWHQPLLKYTKYEGLTLCARADLLPSPEIAEIPSKFRCGILSKLAKSWDRYKKREGGVPRWKGQGDPIRYLYSGNLQKDAKCDGNLIKAPFLGRVHVPGLSDRWVDSNGSTPIVGAFELLKIGEDYKLHLSGRLAELPTAPERHAAVGIDPGMVYKLATSRGYRKPENRQGQKDRWDYEQSLQRQLDHKLGHNLLMWVRHPDRTRQGISDITPLSDKTWEALAAARTLEEIVAAIGNYRFQRLKWRFRSKRCEAIEEKIRAHRAKDRARRKAWDEAWTTLTALKFSHIAIEDGLQDTRNRAKPEPRQDGEGKYLPNGARRKAKFTRRLSEAAPGQTIALLARKATRYGREFQRIPAMGTTINCPVCGHDNEPTTIMDDAQNRLYHCHNCGWNCDRDINAGVNIELAAYGDREGILSPIALSARTQSAQYFATRPDAVKPLWVNGFADAAERYGRDAYHEAISDGSKGKGKGKSKTKKGGSRKVPPNPPT